MQYSIVLIYLIGSTELVNGKRNVIIYKIDLYHTDISIDYILQTIDLLVY